MKLRQMTGAELVHVLQWAATEGWNPGLDDARAFQSTDSEGFFVAEVDDTVAAAISVVNHSDDFAFLGLYICHPDYRGRGIGYALWQHALDHAGGRTVGLDGVPVQQDNYRRSGFEPAAQNRRYAGTLPATDLPRLRPVLPAEIPHLIDLEAGANGYRKHAFLSAWLRDTDTRKTLVPEGGGTQSGFVTVRRCIEGYKIGPLVAPSVEAARHLLLGVGQVSRGASVMIDVPDDQQALAAICEGLGMTPCFSTARMYRGPAPQPAGGVRALATLEVG